MPFDQLLAFVFSKVSGETSTVNVFFFGIEVTVKQMPEQQIEDPIL
jgi:hypothetical protein